ncbi:vascular endothelial growth factor A-like [Parambassis ranga]|uniref:Vascular endothelial growth factor A-like n=1 Tax=Parambassis ranga TaxID=210632 RepID=A0A6P7HST1_9TELE|nr:vascular endothelial growth factor A-like [Parambassis ranga]
MQAFSGISRLLLALLLQLLPAQMAHLPEIAPSKVMGFQEVLVKSMCQPMEQLVDVDHGFLEEVEYIYIPACVSLWRCSGCCGDENMECHPTLERNITLPVVRIYPIMSSEYVQVTFVEHQSCECR